MKNQADSFIEQILVCSIHVDSDVNFIKPPSCGVHFTCHNVDNTNVFLNTYNPTGGFNEVAMHQTIIVRQLTICINT